jgi:hypothetical protein
MQVVAHEDYASSDFKARDGMTRFDTARLNALMQDLLAHVTGRPADLLPFEAVREGLQLRHVVDRGLQEVPLDLIVGTLGREREFNRAFLPRDDALRDRWQGVEGLADGPRGFAPVELYKVGEAYFVVDGHHRVSVARAMGNSSVEARVKEFLSPVPLESGETLEDVLLKRSQAEFLELTGLQPTIPGELDLNVPNGYDKLLEHISVHRYYRGIELGREVSWQEAVASWRDTVFAPMVATIRASGVLEDFPGHTEADLYLFTMDHLHHLRERYSCKPVGPALAVRHFRFFYRGDATVRQRLAAWWRRARARPSPGKEQASTEQ